jgi:hypothetical protein
VAAIGWIIKMKITRRQLKRIIREAFAATAQEEAEKINAQTGVRLMTDQSYWEEMGISTGEELAKSVLSQTYSDYYKSLHGVRPRWMDFSKMSVEDIEAELAQLNRDAEQMSSEDPDEWMEERFHDEQEYWDLEDVVVDAVRSNSEDIPEEYLEYETVPSQQGMGRRAAGTKAQRRMENKIKISKKQLRRIIRESLLCEVDTGVYEGDHDPIRIEIPALEAIAAEENFDGKKVWFSDSDASSIAEMLEDGPPDIERYDYDEPRYEEAVAKWDEIVDVLGDGWYDTEREELAKNIRGGIQTANDAGYEY